MSKKEDPVESIKKVAMEGKTEKGEEGAVVEAEAAALRGPGEGAEVKAVESQEEEAEWKVGVTAAVETEARDETAVKSPVVTELRSR